jgi:HKD family nuclease
VPTSVNFIPQPSAGITVGSTLRSELASATWETFRASVAWAKLSGVQLIQGDLNRFASRPTTAVRISIGIDNGGSSVEAADLLRRLIQPRGELYIYQDPVGSEAPTFHPKVYLFSNDLSAKVIVGSSNLTRGGLFLNHEASIVVDLDLTDGPDEDLLRAVTAQLERSTTPGPSCKPADVALLALLHGSGDLPAEATQRRAVGGQRRALGMTRGLAPPFGQGPRGSRPDRQPEPPGLGPPGVMVVAAPPTATVPVVPVPPLIAAPTVVVPRIHLIEVLPHDNGEIFLSYVAVTRDQPLFFKYPFTGWSTPKLARNPAYPMIQPDPIVDIEILDAAGAVIAAERWHSLNVIEYVRNREIRITVPNGLQRRIPDMSVLEMERDPGASLDYRLRFHPPGSPGAIAALPDLTHAMPGGGRAVPRKYGWR